MDNILVLCIGNICRSPIAEGLFKQAFPAKHIYSAGLSALVGHPADPSAVRIAQEHGLDISHHRAQAISAGLVNQSDLILTMDLEQKHHVERHYPSARGKVFRLCEFNKTDVADPYREGYASFQAAYALISAGVEVMVQRLSEMDQMAKA